ncbi:hypothetical protein Leryth_005734 [Lithospermum erythrorhizon]|nr:hypothetical protein Leryth_005734 [Lithospermum erythrorhizon]
MIPKESLIANSGRRKFIAQEIDKIGKGNISAQVFKYRDLCNATNNFSHDALIGEGGFGRVYKAKLNNMEVAIKQLDRNGFQGNKEFLVEVLVLSLIQHQHLVNLVGYCSDGVERVLAQPLFKDKNKFQLMADPKLEGNYPMKSLYQALAIAAMCLQEEADTRPIISDVVVALDFISKDKTKEDNAEHKVKKKSRTNVEAIENSESNVAMEID